MTLYDIVLEREDTQESVTGFRQMFGDRPNIKLTVRVMPWLPIIVPPGSTLIINRDAGPEAMMTGLDIGLVTRGPEFYTNSHIIDSFTLVQMDGDADQYIAHTGERLIEEAIRKIAEIKVKELG